MDKRQDQEEKGKSSNEEQNKEKDEQISVWEWITGFIGLVLVVGAIGFMLYQAFQEKGLPPDVKIQIESISQIENGYLVKFQALNEGDATAEGLIIEAELKVPEKSETNQTTINFLPAHSTRNGGFFFQNDPRHYELKLRAVGYQKP